MKRFTFFEQIFENKTKESTRSLLTAMNNPYSQLRTASASVHHPAVPPDLPHASCERRDVSHLDHGRREALEELGLAVGETLDDGRGGFRALLRRGEHRLELLSNVAGVAGSRSFRPVPSPPAAAAGQRRRSAARYAGSSVGSACPVPLKL